MENIFDIRDVIEKNKITGKQLYLVFLDIEKAYNTVDRKRLRSLLRHIGMDRKVVKVIENLYENNEVKFSVGLVSTGCLENNVGVKQGCVMSSTLFNIHLEELIRIRVSGGGVDFLPTLPR